MCRSTWVDNRSALAFSRFSYSNTKSRDTSNGLTCSSSITLRIHFSSSCANDAVDLAGDAAVSLIDFVCNNAALSAASLAILCHSNNFNSASNFAFRDRIFPWSPPPPSILLILIREMSVAPPRERSSIQLDWATAAIFYGVSDIVRIQRLNASRISTPNAPTLLSISHKWRMVLKVSFFSLISQRSKIACQATKLPNIAVSRIRTGLVAYAQRYFHLSRALWSDFYGQLRFSDVVFDSNVLSK